MDFKHNFKINGFPLEIIFVLLGLVFGILLINYNPPFHSADESQHFIKSYAYSKGEILPNNPQKQWGTNLPKSILDVLKGITVQFEKGVRISRQKFNDAKKIPLEPDKSIFYKVTIQNIPPIPYLPFAIGIFVGQFIDDNPIWLVYWGRLFGLFAWLAIMYFVIRLVPIGKSIFFLYGLTPIVLYQGASITYDMMNNAMSFVLLAVFLKFAFDDEWKLTTRNLILIFCLIIIHRFSKGGYPFLPFLFFLIPMEKIGKPWKAALIGVGILFTFFLPSYTWDKVVSALNYQVLIGGSRDVVMSSGMQMKHIMSNPMNFLDVLFRNILWQTAEWTRGTMGRFGHSYFNLPDWFYAMHGFVLILVAFFDSNKDISLVKFQKWLLFIVGGGTAALIIVGFYLTGSAVGGSVIFGLQGRYFVPAVPVMLFLLYNNKFYNRNRQRHKWIFLTVYSAFVLTFCVIQFSNFFWVK